MIDFHFSIQLKKFDRELEPLSEILFEYPINFIPSYPFEEDPEMPTDYMSTRCPAWCDRILMTPQVKDIIQSNDWKYDMIGESACMGDHKVITFFELQISSWLFLDYVLPHKYSML